MIKEMENEGLTEEQGEQDGLSKEEQRKQDNFDRWMSTREAAKYVGMSVPGFRMRISKGQIWPQGRIGRSLRFKKEALDEILQEALL